MLATILGIFGIIFILLTVRPITTFFHELGHAIPALIFTKEDVVIYVGSYGNADINKSFVWKTGRLNIIFRYKITDWQLGMCRYKGYPRLGERILIILGGPVFSLILGIVCYFLILHYKDHSFLTLALATLFVSGILDFVINMVPKENPMEIHDGNLVLTDGGQLLYFIKVMNYPPAFTEGLDLIEADQIGDGVEKLKEVIDSGKNDLSLYRMIMDILREEPAKALAFNDQYYNKFKLLSPDFKLIGDLYAMTNQPSSAIQCYSEAIRLNYKNQWALLARAKCYLEVDLEKKALEDLKIVLLIGENEEAKRLMDKVSGELPHSSSSSKNLF